MKLSDALADRLQGENPDHYLSLFGAALEGTGDLSRALRIADAAYAENPHPKSDEDEAWKRVAEEEAEEEFFSQTPLT